jgi:hypothetical protein
MMGKNANSIRGIPLLFSRLLIKNKACSILLFALYLLIDLALGYYISVFVIRSGILGVAVFMAVSLCSAVFAKKTLIYIKGLIYHPVKKRFNISKIILLIFVCLYTVFALSGQILFFDIESKANIFSFVNFFLVIGVTMPMSLGSIVLIRCISSKIKGSVNDFSIRKKRILFAIVFGLVSIIGALALIAYYPAITNSDTSAQFMQAKGMTQMSERYSVFNTLVMGVLLNIFDSPALLAALQGLFLAYVVARAAILLYENGLGFKYCIIFGAAFILIPSNYIMQVTLSDMIVHGISIFWGIVLLYEIRQNPKKLIGSKLLMGELIACMALIYLTGKTGFIIFALIAIVILLIYKFKVKSLNIVFIAASIAFFISGAFCNSNDIKEMPPGSGYMGLGHDIVSVGELGGSLPEGGRYFRERLITEDEYDFSVFSNTYSDPEDIFLDNKPMLFFRAYGKTLITNPQMMTKAIFNRNAPLYSVIAPVRLTDAGYTGQARDEFWSAYYPAQKDTAFKRALDVAVKFSAENSFFNNLFWNSGIYIWFIVISAVVLILSGNKGGLILLLPVAGYILPMIFLNCRNDFMLYWPIILSSWFILVASIATDRTLQGDVDHA